MANNIERLRKLIYAPIRQGVIDLYDNTGREESKFFPILDYAAMRMLLAEDNDGCEQRAAEWINDNLEYLIIPASPNVVNTNIAVSTIFRQGTVEGSLIKFGSFINLGWQLSGISVIMEVCSADLEGTRRLTDVWPTVLLSLNYTMSDVFEKTLSKRKKELDTFPSMKCVLRSIKEYTAPNRFKVEVPLMVLIDEIHERCGNDIILPIMPRSHFYFGGKACLCHCNKDSGLCTLFRKGMIARLPDTWTLTATEADEITARSLLQEFKDSVDRMKGILENMERCRNTLLGMK